MNNRDSVVAFCLSIVSIYLIGAVQLILWIFSSKYLNQEAAVAVTLFILSPVGALLFEPIRKKLEVSIDDLFTSAYIDKSIYRILIFGRAGSGKTTFIKTAFTLADTDINMRSTQNFKSYQFRSLLQGIDGESTKVAIADYKGQDLLQVILNAPQDFFGAPGSRVLNAIIFIVDLVPRKSDRFGNPFNDEDMLEWLRSGNMLDIIRARVKEHHEYINEASLQLLFGSLHSQNLKTVIFVINKIDLIDRLIDNGYLNISNFSNGREYAKHLFKGMIENVFGVCQALGIEYLSNRDSLVFIVSTRSRDELNPILRLLGTRS
ncbi:hypothetical protein QUB10_16010 [Microcoleus sp. B5-D4]|uniref:hypothetical protein n=1 Tax=unclassified Microcoleus TaxID=2642155 RepID=UPI002FCE93D1